MKHRGLRVLSIHDALPIGDVHNVGVHHGAYLIPMLPSALLSPSYHLLSYVQQMPSLFL